MSSMNIATQKRLGRLPKTPEILTGTRGGYYGGSHAGFGTRTPTPILPGFFGLGSAEGDGKLHYFGNDEGQSGLPVGQGFYGTTLGGHQTEMDYQAANITIPQGQPTHADTPGLFDLSMSETFVTSQTVIIGAVALAAVMLLK